MTAEEILKKAKWNNNTIYGMQITFEVNEKRSISVPMTKEGMTREQAEAVLVEAVQKELGND